MYNVATNLNVISDIKKSRYFKTTLGLSNSIVKNGDRVYNDRDKFSFFYNSKYKTTIFCQGSIGDIMFYVDHYIKDDSIAFYYNMEEFILKHDKNIIKENNIEFYIGHLIKTIETQYEERIKDAENKKFQIQRESNPDILITNPGSATYKDLQAYIQRKNKERYSSTQEPEK